ncbi:hypothetical protein HPB50_023020 [Hyalomma asiaticum]|uniref:Uncharacterized protein n=1 Tax=Hyalomma asiaticum TaxID=266040 RepID=A0ACB7SBD7_HYAAI|nr:hypothetical protein HPB50_023020 [Hyalomma asiaticum]
MPRFSQAATGVRSNARRYYGHGCDTPASAAANSHGATCRTPMFSRFSATPRDPTQGGRRAKAAPPVRWCHQRACSNSSSSSETLPNMMASSSQQQQHHLGCSSAKVPRGDSAERLSSGRGGPAAAAASSSSSCGR